MAKGTSLEDSITATLHAIFNSQHIKRWWTKRIVNTLGLKETMTLISDAFTIAYSDICPKVSDNSRKRDLGGVIIHLLHSSKYVRPRQHGLIFGNLKKYV